MEKVFVISGPSGSGKGTIIKAIREEFGNMAKLVTTTTRAPRGEDVAGKTYNFVSKEEFEQWIKNDEIIEYNFHFDNYYGSRKKDVEDLLLKGKNVLIEVEVKGAMTFKEKLPKAVLIFIKPPTIEELRKRILGREDPGKEELEKRIARAEEELVYAEKYDYVVVNDVLETAINETKEIINKELNG
jgi:guanylate kinase